MVTVAVTGASGFVGRALVRALQARGDVVRPLVRRRPRPGEAYWNPATGALDPAGLEGVDAVVHLAGEPIAQRWTPSVRARIRRSRVDGARLLAEAMARLPRPPAVFVSASAIGIYGDRGDEELDEGSPPGTGFLAELAQAWEVAAEPAAAVGVRVVHPRFGVVLGADGGLLARLRRPFRWGLGGTIGSGRQWLSWVAKTDAVAAVLFLLARSDVRGPVNVVAPEPTRWADFAQTLGRVLGRPARWRLPVGPLKLLFGADMVRETMLASQRVRPRRLLESGFAFAYPTLEAALRGELAG